MANSPGMILARQLRPASKPSDTLGRVGVAGPTGGGKGGEPPLRFLTKRTSRGATVLTGA